MIGERLAPPATTRRDREREGGEKDRARAKS